MSDSFEAGVLYTEHAGLPATMPGLTSLWSYETQTGGRDRASIMRNPDGGYEYWLDRSDPLLNTILPCLGVSLVVNLGDLWAGGRSLATSEFLPRICVVGPVTQARIVRVGKSVHAVGAGLQSPLIPFVFGVQASELVDRIVPLQDLWPFGEVDRLFGLLSHLGTRRSLAVLRDELVARTRGPDGPETVGQTAPRLIKLYAGQVSINEIATTYGLSRREFGRRFFAAAGVPPKLFARITRFQALVHALLSTDVSRWASLSPAVGFYDQAHMINEFSAFAGSPPTVFFRPHGGDIEPARIQLRGRPSEWLRRSGPLGANESPARSR